MLHTILQIIAFQALFLLIYDLFLKRETFFNYNRAYLLITAVLSFVLPFLKLPELRNMATKDVVIQLPEVFIGTKPPSPYEIQIAEQAGIIIEQPQIPIWQSIAIAGVVIAALLFLFKITKLYWLKYKNPKRWQGNVLIVKLIKSTAAFSFFNTIFLGEQIPEQQKTTIYKHELVHIKELHSLDLLFFELLRIVCWFNPLVYIYQNRIKELHEYIADAKAVKENGKSDYYQSLLHQVFDVNQVSFTNTFFKSSLIKKRIAMLQKSKSRQRNLIKYAMLIPIVLGMLIYTSTEVRAQQKTTQESSLDQELTDEELIQKYYDEIIKLDKNKRENYDTIQDNFNFSKEKYIPTKIEYLKYVAYLRYMREMFESAAKNSEKILIRDQNRFDNVYNMTKSYDEYLEYLKTEDAKKSRDNALYNRTLRVISEDIDQLTKEEHKDAYEKVADVLKARLYQKLIISDKDEAVEISKRNYDALVRFFSAKEIKSLLSFVEVEEVVEIEAVDENIEVPFSVVESVPTLIEHKDVGSNKLRKEYMSVYINEHVAENFNMSIADSLNPGRKRIFVQFKIDTEGNVKDIIARGPNPELEVEAKRVISTLPQFTPGMQKGKLVTVPYSIPIVFEVKGNSNTPNYEKFVDSLGSSEKLDKLIYERDRLLQNSSEKNPVVINLNKQIDAIKRIQIEKEKLYLKLLEQREKQKIEEVKISEVTKNNNLDEVSFSVAEIAPIHPDCSALTSKTEKLNCTVDAVNRHVLKNFNKDLANTLGLESGQKRVFIRFVIDKQGDVTNIDVRGPHELLEEEAVRVMKLLPRFTPGRHDGEVVDVPHALPIFFEVKDTKKD